MQVFTGEKETTRKLQSHAASCVKQFEKWPFCLKLPRSSSSLEEFLHLILSSVENVKNALPKRELCMKNSRLSRPEGKVKVASNKFIVSGFAHRRR